MYKLLNFPSQTFETGKVKLGFNEDSVENRPWQRLQAERAQLALDWASQITLGVLCLIPNIIHQEGSARCHINSSGSERACESWRRDKNQDPKVTTAEGGA